MKNWSWCWVLLVCACGGETAGQSIAIDWTLGAESVEREFVTDTGWQVRLEEARVGIESVAAIAPSADQPGALAMLSNLLVPVAHAHGGYDDASGRRVRAELLDMWALDALADEPERLEGESAEAGDIDTIKIELARARAEDKLPSSLHGYAAWARGSAEREGLRVTFEGGVSFSDQEPARRIETRAKFSLDEGGTLRVAVRPSEWFRKAEFDRIAEAAEGAPRVISSTDQVGRAFQIGARSPLAFEVSWKTSED